MNNTSTVVGGEPLSELNGRIVALLRKSLFCRVWRSYVVQLSANLLGVPPCEQRPASSRGVNRSVQFELLGLKWLSKISIAVAKELTPYEVGDRSWRSSVHTLSSGNENTLSFGICLSVHFSIGGIA